MKTVKKSTEATIAETLLKINEQKEIVEKRRQGKMELLIKLFNKE